MEYYSIRVYYYCQSRKFLSPPPHSLNIKLVTCFYCYWIFGMLYNVLWSMYTSLQFTRNSFFFFFYVQAGFVLLYFCPICDMLQDGEITHSLHSSTMSFIWQSFPFNAAMPNQSYLPCIVVEDLSRLWTMPAVGCSTGMHCSWLVKSAVSACALSWIFILV